MSATASDYKMARVLGWASLGIAAVEILAPNFLARQLGIKPHLKLFRSLGVREVASGIGILSQRRVNPKLAGGLWSRGRRRGRRRVDDARGHPLRA